MASFDRDGTLTCAAALVTEEQSVSRFVGYVCIRDNACMDQTNSLSYTLALVHVPAKFCECGFPQICPHSTVLGGRQMILGHCPIL